ncbi:MAG TPA: hypothetical protein PL110_18290, partial [Candidatus Eremiobacteraeota bacterium]|nr:hypothetical protein [Candidatus Eremiobacteraeota bacterium]
MEPAIEERVYRLEALMERFIIEMVDYKSQTQYAISRLSNEIRDFKSHTDKIIEEMKEDTRKLKANLDEDTRKLKANLDKDTASLKEEVRKTSKKLGHIIEDIFAPNVQFVAEKYFNCKDCQMFGVRFKQINIVTKQLKEFDVVAVYPDKIVVGEVKSNP